jgi:hypothetical protein
MEEEDYIHSTQLINSLAALAAAAMAARLLSLQLSFSPLSCTHSHSLSCSLQPFPLLSQNHASFIGIQDISSQQWLHMG